MAHPALLALGRIIQLHPGFDFCFGFLVPVAAAYWFFVVTPYRKNQTERLLSPWRVRQPAVPGVLERYAAWELTGAGHLTPFGQWIQDELARQRLSLPDLARRSGMALDSLVSALYQADDQDTDPRLIRELASLLGAGEHQTERLLQAELTAAAESRRQP